MVGEGKEVVLITGGSGFLAQHLIKDLQENYFNRIAEIKVADKKLFTKFLDYPDNIPVTEWIVDCVEEDEMEPVLKDVTSVFHLCARRYSYDMYEDREKHWEDSVISTKTLVQLMTRHSVQWLVFVGDAMSVIGDNEDAQMPVEMGTLNPPKCKRWMLGAYGEAKFRAEEIVRRNNGIDLPSGKKLYTAIVRPTPLYGEGDTGIVPHSYALCKQYNGVLQKFGWQKDIVLQLTYAGNCAAMTNLIWKKLQLKPKEFGSEVFFCTESDDCTNYYNYIQPFLDVAGYKFSTYAVPYEIGTALIWVLEKFFRSLAMLDIYFPHNLPNANMIRVVAGLNYHFSGTKSRLMLDWKPPHDPDKAMKRTIEWWRKNYKMVV